MNVGILTGKDRFRSVSSKIAGVTLANLLITALNIVAGVVVARYFALVEYGQLSYFVNIFGSLRLLGSLGLTSQISFALAQARGRGEPSGSLFYQLLKLRIATLGMFIVGLGAIGLVRGDVSLLLASGAAVLALLADFGIGALQGLGRVRQVIIALWLQPVLYVVGLVPIIILHQPIAVLYLLFAGSFFPPIVLAAAYIARTLPHSPVSSHTKISLSEALRFSGSMYGLALCGTLFTSYATLYLGALGNFADTALITIPLNIIFMPGALLNTASSTIYFPRLSHAEAQHNAAEARTLFQAFTSAVVVVGLLIAANLLLYPQTLLYILYGTRYLASAPLLGLLAIVAFAYPLQSLLTTTLAAQGCLRAALLYVGISTILLLMGVTLAARYTADLRLVALAHVVAVVPVLVWQLQTAAYPLRRMLTLAGRALLFLCVLGAVARLCVPDAPSNLPGAIIALTAITLLYAGWAWRALRNDS